jgi:hypothetical protein
MQNRSKRENSKIQIKEAFREITKYLELEPGIMEINYDLDAVEEVITIEQLVFDIVQSGDMLFWVEPIKPRNPSEPIKSYRFDCSKLGEWVLHNIIKNNFTLIQDTFPQPTYRLNPYVELFMRHVEDKNMKEFLQKTSQSWIKGCNYGRGLVGLVNMINDFIDGIRKEVKSPQFKSIIKSHQRAPNKNYASLVKYIKALFQRYARLLVLRIDLAYGEGHFVDYSEAKNDLRHFLNNWRSNALFDDLVGYAWKLEFTPKTGFHYHFLFFSDGSKAQKDILIAQGIGEYWNTTITRGRGRYYNCNAYKERYGEKCGIGMINYHDAKSRENLLQYVAPYLTKPDHYARIIVPKPDRTFGRGEMPKPRADKRGRPRRKYPLSGALA